MKFSLVNFIYLLFRLSPYIIVSFFLLQFVFNHDFIAVIYFFGLILTIIIAFGIGWIGKKLDFLKGELTSKKQTCNMFNVGYEGNRFSYFLLNPVVLGFSFFFFTITAIKHAGTNIDLKNTYEFGDRTFPKMRITNDFLKQNIPLFVILPILILGDIFITIYNDCDIPLKLLLSLTVGSGCGISTAWIGDYELWKKNNKNDQIQAGVCGTDRGCKMDHIDAVHATKAKAGSIDLSLYNIFNNPTCDQPYSGFYKCRMVSKNSKTPTVASDADNLINELNTISNTNLEKSGLYAYIPVTKTTTIDVNSGKKNIPSVIVSESILSHIINTNTNKYDPFYTTIVKDANTAGNIIFSGPSVDNLFNTGNITKFSPIHTDTVTYSTNFVDEYKSTDGEVWMKYYDGKKENRQKHGITLTDGNNAFWAIMSDKYHTIMG
jgi:hypothetical protein